MLSAWRDIDATEAEQQVKNLRRRIVGVEYEIESYRTRSYIQCSRRRPCPETAAEVLRFVGNIQGSGADTLAQFQSRERVDSQQEYGP